MKSVVKYQLSDYTNVVIVYFLIFIFCVILGAVSAGWGDGRDISTSIGSEASGAIINFVLGIVMFKEHYWMFAQNGISRKTYFKGTLVSIGIISLVMAVGNQAIVTVTHTFTGTAMDMYRTFLQVLYPEFPRNAAVWHIANILFIESLSMLTFATGLLISSIFYRVHKIVKVFVAAGLPILAFLILPMTLTYIPMEPFWKNVFDVCFILVGGQAGNPFYAVVLFLAGAVALFSIDYVVIRKAQI